MASTPMNADTHFYETASGGEAPTAAGSPRIAFVSLGCPKALVDSERIISQLRAEGYELTKAYSGAAAVIVNTCGFIDSAKAEIARRHWSRGRRKRQNHRHRLHGRGAGID